MLILGDWNIFMQETQFLRILFNSAVFWSVYDQVCHNRRKEKFDLELSHLEVILPVSVALWSLFKLTKLQCCL